jgi:hypothetical protein
MSRLLLRSLLAFFLLGAAVGCGDSGEEKGTAPMPKSGPIGSSPGEAPLVAPPMKN